MRAWRTRCLLGVTGSGKTYTMAKVVEAIQKPTLVIAHNKTLAAQLYSEFREFLPKNMVEYFVSYYDYYQPEAYIPRSDTYIEKDAQVNEEIERLRLAATSALFSRGDVVIVASVSCIYGLGSPQDYGQVALKLNVGEMVRRNQVLRHLVDIFYERNDTALQRAKFRVRGDVLEVQPAYSDNALRVSFWGDEVERISEIDTLTGEILDDFPEVEIFPAKHFITHQEQVKEAIVDIEAELKVQTEQLESLGKLLEAQRIGQRTRYDIEMLQEIGYCNGVENYSRHLARRPPGSRPMDPARLFSGRLVRDYRREPHDDPADSRHVRRRPLAQGGPGRARFPPAERTRQPPAQIR